jgi:hypothetical protein
LSEFRKTPDGREISSRGRELHDFTNLISGGLGHALDNRQDSTLTTSDFPEWASQNGIRCDFDQLTAERGQNIQPEHKAVYDTLKYLSPYDAPLYKLALGLIETPQFRIGNPVTVMRNSIEGQPEYLENDWVVDGILASGLLRIRKADDTLTKRVSLTTLRSWN